MIKRVVVYKVVGEIQLKHLYLVYHISRIPRKLYKLLRPMKIGRWKSK